MAWIESNQELARHPKAKKAARMLGVSVPSIVGHLHFLWWWCLEYAQDGDLSKFDAMDIAEAAGWEAAAEPFVQALIDCGPGDSFGFLEQPETGGLVIHDWMDYAGRLVVQRENTKEKTRDRVKKYRDKTGKTCNADVTRYDGVTVTACNAPTVPNPTVPTVPTVPNSTVPINNNNTREEIEVNANDLEKNIVEKAQIANELGETITETEETYTMAIGTKAINWVEKNWGRMIPKGEADSIIAWCDEFVSRGSPEPDAVVIEALKRCLDADARNANYLRAVLTDWRENGVLTVANIEAREVARKADHKSQKEQKHGKNRGDMPKNLVPKKDPNRYDNFYL